MISVVLAVTKSEIQRPLNTTQISSAFNDLDIDSTYSTLLPFSDLDNLGEMLGVNLDYTLFVAKNYLIPIIGAHSTKLHFLHLNVNRLLPKIDEVKYIAKRTNANIIGISESKLDKTVLDGELKIDGYELIRSDRNGHGGGVACYVKTERHYNVRGFSSPEFEHIFIDILLPNSKPILIGILHRPPDQLGFLDKVSSAIGDMGNFDEQEVYILGDLNYNLLNEDNYIFEGKNPKNKVPRVKSYIQFCSLHNLKQIIRTSTLLDHFLTNGSEMVSQVTMAFMGFSKNKLAWFRSYLTNRTFLVNVGKSFSDPGKLECGVPQGSILGPLLFLLYVNDMPGAVSYDMLLYADDTCLIFHAKDLSSLSEKLNSEFNNLCDWFVDNKLSIHFGEDKTKSILFSVRNRPKDDRLNITRGSINVSQYKEVNYLVLFV